jgi:periplasmic protein TonB
MSISVLALLAAAQPATEKPPVPPARPPIVVVAPAPPTAEERARGRVLTPSRGAVPGPIRAHAAPRMPLQSLITLDDYPAAALRGRDQGTARFMLTVDQAGRVAGCVILASTGSAALDSATCRLVRARARFTPARDANGQPVEDRYWDQIAWRLQPGG